MIAVQIYAKSEQEIFLKTKDASLKLSKKHAQEFIDFCSSLTTRMFQFRDQTFLFHVFFSYEGEKISFNDFLSKVDSTCPVSDTCFVTKSCWNEILRITDAHKFSIPFFAELPLFDDFGVVLKETSNVACLVSLAKVEYGDGVFL